MLSEAGKAQLTAVFKRIDRDRDGAINRREFIKALRTNPDIAALFVLPGRVRQGPGDDSHARFEAFFQALDTDGDDRVTLAELLRHSAHFAPQTETQLQVEAAAAAPAGAAPTLPQLADGAALPPAAAALGGAAETHPRLGGVKLVGYRPPEYFGAIPLALMDGREEPATEAPAGVEQEGGADAKKTKKSKRKKK